MSRGALFRLISRRDVNITLCSRNIIFQTALRGPGGTAPTSLEIGSMATCCDSKPVTQAPILRSPSILHKTHDMICPTSLSLPSPFPLGLGVSNFYTIGVSIQIRA